MGDGQRRVRRGVGVAHWRQPPHTACYERPRGHAYPPPEGDRRRGDALAPAAPPDRLLPDGQSARRARDHRAERGKVLPVHRRRRHVAPAGDRPLRPPLQRACGKRRMRHVRIRGDGRRHRRRLHLLRRRDRRPHLRQSPRHIHASELVPGHSAAGPPAPAGGAAPCRDCEWRRLDACRPGPLRWVELRRPRRTPRRPVLRLVRRFLLRGRPLSARHRMSPQEVVSRLGRRLEPG